VVAVEVVRNKRQSISSQSQRRQRGAVAVFVAIALLALLTATMLAIETGRLYGAHRQLQKAATLAALDAARVVSGCGSSSPTQTLLDTRVTSSLASNGYGSTGGVTAFNEAGTIQTLTTNGVAQRSLLPGSMSTAKAVRVTLSAPFPAQIIPLFTPGGTMKVSATATQQVQGSLSVGTGLASLNNGLANSLLSALLGGNINLSALDYQGIAQTNVTLGQLQTALGVQDLSDPTSLQITKTPSSILNGLASALTGTANAQVIAALQNLSGNTTNNGPINLSGILQPIGSIASNVPVANLGDVLLDLATATRANSGGGATPIELKNLSLSIAGVTLKVYLNVIQPPQYSGLGRPGATSATSSQIKLMLRLQISTVSSLINSVSGLLSLLASIQVDPVNLGIDLNVAQATGYLDRVDCPSIAVNGGSPTAYLSAKTGVATVSIGTYTGTPAPTTPLTSGAITGLRISSLLLGSVAYNVNIPTIVSATVGDNTVRPLPLPVTNFSKMTGIPAGFSPVYIAAGSPFATPTTPVAANPQTVSSGSLLSSALSTLLTSLNLRLDQTSGSSGLLGLLGTTLQLVTNSLVPAIQALLTPILTGVGSLVDAIINPLLQALGLQVGSATVFMDLVTSGQPVIITTVVP
jgi:uncharacterized membrane protein